MRYSFNQAAYELLDLYRTRLRKDEDIDMREIKRWVRTKRSLWLRNEYNKNRVIDDACEQDLGAVPMTQVDGTLIGTSSTVKCLISTRVIPTAVELYDRPAITRVGPKSKLSYNYLPFTPLTRLPFIGLNRFNANSIYCFQWNNKIGVAIAGTGTNTNFTDILTYGLNIIGVFEDPIEAGRYPEVGDTVGIAAGYSTTKYYDDDTEGSLHDWMLEYMKNELIKLEGNIAEQITKQDEVRT
jgi:hypothetical protein